MEHINIWWMDKWLMMATNLVLDEAQAAMASAPVLPGHIQLAIRSISRDMYDGRVIAPMTLQQIDPEQVREDNKHCDLSRAFNNGWLGILVEEVHLPTLRQYPGILTNIKLKAV